MSKEREKLISDAVEKAIAGDMDAINNIEDRVVRSKAKAALAKEKRLQKDGSSPDADLSGSDVPTVSNAPSESPNRMFGDRINQKFPGSLDGDLKDTHIQLKPDQWNDIAIWLKTEDDMLFDSLQCITGMDMGEDVLEARYNLHSMKYRFAIEIRIAIPKNKAEIPSIEQVWRIGDWFERETYDMYGISFSGHTDLRRILLPDDWEGWPLRKDYEVQETYHGIVVPKVKEGWE